MEDAAPEAETRRCSQAPIPLDTAAVPRLPNDIFTGWLGDQVDAVAAVTETPREGMFSLSALGTVCQKRFRSDELTFRYGLPVALLLLPLAPPAAAVVRRRRAELRRSAQRCERCGHDLRATPDRCPECGTVPQGAARTAA